MLLIIRYQRVMPFVKENISLCKRMLATGAEFSLTRTNFCREAHVVIQLESVVLAARLTLLPFFSELRLETNLGRFTSYLGVRSQVSYAADLLS